MKNLKFGIKLLPFLLAGSMTVAVGVPAYENRPRKFDEITDCTNIDRVIYEKYEKISYEDFKKLLGEKNKEFAQNHLSVNQIASSLHKYYEQILTL